MPQTEDIEQSFITNPPADAPLILIYSAQHSPRLNYVLAFIFNQVLGVRFKVTHDLDFFKNEDGFRINYSASELHEAVQIIPQQLIFETGVSAYRPLRQEKNGLIYFFENALPAPSAFPYDIFSAVFYFISRYEEWQSYEKDSHGRFEAKASLLYPGHYHLKPVADYWVQELKEALAAKYPSLQFPEKKMQVISTLDIDNLYAYKAKGFLRTTGACVKDLVKLNFVQFWERLKVVAVRAHDPFDIYADVSAFCKENSIPLYFFFLFRTGTAYDRTVNPFSEAFKPVFKILNAMGAHVGLHPSYYSATSADILAGEVKNLAEQLAQPVIFSRQHYLRFDIKNTPHQLLKNGIVRDFTMGYASSPGFRAGTSYPFYYYDLDAEKQRDLLFVPFCAMDGAYFVYSATSPEQTFHSIMQLAEEVRKTNGYFISVFHERTFSNHLYPGFGPLYKKIHQRLKE